MPDKAPSPSQAGVVVDDLVEVGMTSPYLLQESESYPIKVQSLGRPERFQDEQEWMAWRCDWKVGMPRGYGRTANDAVADLLRQETTAYDATHERFIEEKGE